MRKEYLYVDNIGETKAFLVERLGCREVEGAQSQGTVLETRGGTMRLVVTERESSPLNTYSGRSWIVIDTDDCLRDFYYLRNAPVSFLNEPYYRPDGLAADFTDRSGNLFSLLERRQYLSVSDEDNDENFQNPEQ